MSSIGKNIRKIRGIKKLSQTAFADQFGLARASVGSYEEGRAEPKIETIIDIAHYFGISIDALLTKELTVNELYHFDIFKQEFAATGKQPSKKKKRTRSVDDVRLIESSIQLDYILKYTDPTFMDDLLNIDLPIKLAIPARAFEMNDHQMEFNGQGIHPGDLVLGELLKEHKPAEGEVAVVVTKQTIWIRRVKYEGEELVLLSDHPSYPKAKINSEDILECWQAKLLVSKHLLAPLQVQKKLAELERRIEALSKK